MAKEKDSKVVRADSPAKPKVPARAGGTLARWPMFDWERDLDNWFDDIRRRFGFPLHLAGERRLPAPEFRLHMPAIDVYEKDDDVIVKAEVPGMAKEDIEVNLSDSTLTIRGEKKRAEEVKDEHYHRCERSYGSFLRTVELPTAVKAEAVSATFKDGVLEVRLPKTEEAKRKPIKVEVR